MEKKDFNKRYAQRTQSTPAEAADQIDAVINDLLRRLRAGQPAPLPGLGTLLPSAKAPSQQQEGGRRARTKTKAKLKAKGASR
jgi:nucleoid DNA-binding protein